MIISDSSRVLFVRLILMVKNISIQTLVNKLCFYDCEVTKSALHKMIKGKLKVSDKIFLKLINIYNNDVSLIIFDQNVNGFISNRMSFIRLLDAYFSENHELIGKIPFKLDLSNIEIEFQYYVAAFVFNKYIRGDHSYIKYLPLFNELSFDPRIDAIIGYLRIHANDSTYSEAFELMRLYALIETQSVGQDELRVNEGIKGFLSHEYARRISHLSKEKALKALELSKLTCLNAGYIKFSIGCMLGETAIYIELNQFDKAEYNCRTLLKTIEHVDDNELKCRAMANLGNILYYRESYREAVPYFLNALKLYTFSVPSRISFLITLIALDEWELLRQYTSTSSFMKSRFTVNQFVLKSLKDLHNTGPLETLFSLIPSLLTCSDEALGRVSADVVRLVKVLNGKYLQSNAVDKWVQNSENDCDKDGFKIREPLNELMNLLITVEE